MAASATNPLMRIRAGIEAGKAEEVLAGVADADKNNVQLAPNVRDMITQWLKANAPEALEKMNAKEAAKNADQGRDNRRREEEEEGVTKGSGAAGWSTDVGFKQGKTDDRPQLKLTADLLRLALMKFFKGAPKGCDAAAGLGIIEGEDGKRFLPLPILGKACGVLGEDFQVYQAVWNEIDQAPKGVFALSPDARGAGLVEWAGWDDFQSALQLIVKGTRDPAFEPRNIQAHILQCAKGAVRSGVVRQPDVLRSLGDSLNPQDMPEDAAPALRSAISRRTRLALACVVDATAKFGLGEEAGPDAMGLVGQLPRTLFGYLFDKIDDRDRGACAFLGEMLQSWDKRRCFSKRWLQDAAGKFSMPKGANVERDDGRGWYALTADNIETKAPEDAKKEAEKAATNGGAVDEPVVVAEPESKRRAKSRSPSKRVDVSASPVKRRSPAKDAPRQKKPRVMALDEEDDEAVNKRLEESRKRREKLMSKYRDDQD